ncbi:hypothetical protein [Tunturiibacter lichenicola]|uniref:hypothetical protein n=1 Tax=Tunturiibacter lichenicola TaxID=2051959 RepID=UPI0021B3BBCA|nr:hypothetical protein [Edaphobacter lichenicola]
MLKLLAVLLCLVGFVTDKFVADKAPLPERTVHDTTLVSQHDPHVQIQLPASAQYVGAERWPLYDIADCELHAFVEADHQHNVHKLYWIQFEGYLPSRPDMHHTYDSPRHLQMGGLDFYVDTWIRADGEKTESGSDREHIETMIRAKGYKMPAGMLYVRLVHLLDAEKRRELMIIYGEDLQPTGFAVTDLNEGGKAHDRLPALEADITEQAKQKIHLQPLEP